MRNLSMIVEDPSQLEKIHIQSPFFDPQKYFELVHADTESSVFMQGIQNLKQKIQNNTN